MALRLLPVRGGTQALTLGSESVTLRPAVGPDGAEAEESALLEADAARGLVFVTWLGAQGVGRIFRKGGSAVESLEAGIEAELAIGDKVDIAACDPDRLESEPQSSSTFMVTATRRAAPSQASQQILALPSTQLAPEAESEPQATDAQAQQADAAVSISLQPRAAGKEPTDAAEVHQNLDCIGHACYRHHL